MGLRSPLFSSKPSGMKGHDVFIHSSQALDRPSSSLNTKEQKTWALMLHLGGYMEICCHASVGGTSVCQDV